MKPKTLTLEEHLELAKSIKTIRQEYREMFKIIQKNYPKSNSLSQRI